MNHKGEGAVTIYGGGGGGAGATNPGLPKWEEGCWGGGEVK